MNKESNKDKWYRRAITRERESNTKIKRSKKDQHLPIQWHSKSVCTKFYLQLIYLFFPTNIIS